MQIMNKMQGPSPKQNKGSFRRKLLSNVSFIHTFNEISICIAKMCMYINSTWAYKCFIKNLWMMTSHNAKHQGTTATFPAFCTQSTPSCPSRPVASSLSSPAACAPWRTLPACASGPPLALQMSHGRAAPVFAYIKGNITAGSPIALQMSTSIALHGCAAPVCANCTIPTPAASWSCLIFITAPNTSMSLGRQSTCRGHKPHLCSSILQLFALFQRRIS
eukprot:scaffold51326_cov19-Tisochrysis_lutea.AAC.1